MMLPSCADSFMGRHPASFNRMKWTSTTSNAAPDEKANERKREIARLEEKVKGHEKAIKELEKEFEERRIEIKGLKKNIKQNRIRLDGIIGAFEPTLKSSFFDSTIYDAANKAKMDMLNNMNPPSEEITNTLNDDSAWETCQYQLSQICRYAMDLLLLPLEEEDPEEKQDEGMLQFRLIKPTRNLTKSEIKTMYLWALQGMKAYVVVEDEEMLKDWQLKDNGLTHARELTNAIFDPSAEGSVKVDELRANMAQKDFNLGQQLGTRVEKPEIREAVEAVEEALKHRGLTVNSTNVGFIVTTIQSYIEEAY